jgi:hypothetical protein
VLPETGSAVEVGVWYRSAEALRHPKSFPVVPTGLGSESAGVDPAVNCRAIFGRRSAADFVGGPYSQR